MNKEAENIEFKHYSVLLEETIDGLQIKPNGTYVDGTLGGGGHASYICQHLSPNGTLIGIDRDQDALNAASERLKDYPFRDRSNKLISALIAEPCEEVEITASDGKRLAGRYYHRADGAPLDIMFHGYMSGALHDFPGGALEAMAAGHNVLLVDQRGHGKSHGKTVSFGIKERFDCLDWAR